MSELTYGIRANVAGLLFTNVIEHAPLRYQELEITRAKYPSLDVQMVVWAEGADGWGWQLTEAETP